MTKDSGSKGRDEDVFTCRAPQQPNDVSKDLLLMQARIKHLEKELGEKEQVLYDYESTFYQ